MCQLLVNLKMPPVRKKIRGEGGNITYFSEGHRCPLLVKSRHLTTTFRMSIFGVRADIQTHAPKGLTFSHKRTYRRGGRKLDMFLN